MPLRPCTSVWIAVVLARVSFPHDVPLDASRDSTAPFGAIQAGATERAGLVPPVLDKARRTYVFIHRSDAGELRYEIRISRSDVKAGKLTVNAVLDRERAFLPITAASASMASGHLGVVHDDGSIVWLAVDVFDVDADGKDKGFMVERAGGYGHCIRLGKGFPIEARSSGFAVWRYNGPPGKFRLVLRYFDDADDRADDARIRLSVAGRELARVNPSIDDNQWHELAAMVELHADDTIRIDARADDSGGKGNDFCRISTVTLKPAEARPGLGSRLVSHAIERDVLSLAYVDPLAGYDAVRTIRIRLQGKTLVLRIQGPKQGFAAGCGYRGFGLGRATGLDKARLVRLPYCNEPIVCANDAFFFSTYFDRFHTNATVRSGKCKLHDDGTVTCHRGFEYLANSAGRFEPLDETAYLTVSKRMLDVVPRINGRRAGAGRRDLGKRVVVDIWGLGQGAEAAELFQMVHGLGMHDLLILAHNWRCHGYDRKQPVFYPANPQRWTEEEFKAFIAKVKGLGYRVALHENYNHMDWDSPYFDKRFFSKLADGRVSPGPMSRPSPPAHPISSDKMLHFAQIEGHKIKNAYAPNAGYLDVTPCVRPGMSTWDMHIDLDAANTQARSWAMAYRNAWRLFVHHRDLYGLLTGEGGTYASWNAGYVEAVERQVRTKMDTPILPHFELYAIKPLSFHHGMGYYSRYFPKGKPRTEDGFRAYRAMSIAFGHAGFSQHFRAGQMPRAVEAMKEYYLMRKLQELYADAAPTLIEYESDGRRLDVSRAMLLNYDFANARLHIAYDSGLEIWLNFDRRGEWQVHAAGRGFTLPANGWVAICSRARFEAWSARVDDQRVEHVSCDDYLFSHRAQSPAIAYRSSGMGGLSGLDVGGMVLATNAALPSIRVGSPARWRPAGRYALTVLNEGAAEIASTLHLRHPGISAHAQVVRRAYRVIVKAADLKGQWTPLRTGVYRVFFQYIYTDPQHLDVTNKRLVCEPVPGASVTVSQSSASRSKPRSCKLRRSKDYVEMQAQIVVPVACERGRPVDVAALGVRPGCGGPDNDFTTDYALVFEHVESGQRQVVAFQTEPQSFSKRMRVADRRPFVFPPATVTTLVFEASD